LARVGVLPDPAAEPSLTVTEVHDSFDALAEIAGSGSQAARRTAMNALFGPRDCGGAGLLRGLVTAKSAGALDALVQEAVAQCAGPLVAVRRSAMLSGSTLAAAVAAFDGGEAALAEFGLEVGRPVLPMLASSAPTSGPPWPRRSRTVRWSSTPSSTGSGSRPTAVATTCCW
jgi:DNA ligase-1